MAKDDKIKRLEWSHALARAEATKWHRVAARVLKNDLLAYVKGHEDGTKHGAEKCAALGAACGVRVEINGETGLPMLIFGDPADVDPKEPSP